MIDYEHININIIPLLQMAGAAVKKATETLVKAAQQASVQVEEERGGGAFGPAVSHLCKYWIICVHFIARY